MGKARPVRVYAWFGDYIGEYATTRLAAEELGLSRQNIVKCCNRLVLHTHGFIFRRSDDDELYKLSKRERIAMYLQSSHRGKGGMTPVTVYRNNEVVGVFQAIAGAASLLGLNDRSIFQALRKSNGRYRDFIFRPATIEEIERYGGNTHIPSRNPVKSIRQYTLNGEFVAEYQTLREANAETSISISSINGVLRQKRKSAGGYMWAYADDSSANIEPIKREKEVVPIRLYDRSGAFVKEYPSGAACEKELGLPKASIFYACEHKLQRNNLQFRFKKDEQRDRIEPFRRTVILQFTKEGQFVRSYNSLTEAAKFLGKTDSDRIRRACIGSSKSAYGYLWRYKEVEG